MSRLELFLARAQGDVGIETIRKQIANAITGVVYVGLDPIKGKRRILSVYEIEGASDGNVSMGPMYDFSNNGKVYWVRGTGVSRYQQVLSNLGCRMSGPAAYWIVGRNPDDRFPFGI